MRILSIATAAAALFVVTAAACSGIENALCNDLVLCEAGNDHDRAACIETYQASGKVASDYGCSESWHNLLVCIDSTAICDKGQYKDSCDAAYSAVAACEKAASVRGDRHFALTAGP